MEPSLWVLPDLGSLSSSVSVYPAQSIENRTLEDREASPGWLLAQRTWFSSKIRSAKISPGAFTTWLISNTGGPAYTG